MCGGMVLPDPLHIVLRGDLKKKSRVRGNRKKKKNPLIRLVLLSTKCLNRIHEIYIWLRKKGKFLASRICRSVIRFGQIHYLQKVCGYKHPKSKFTLAEI